jgi:hypothetical protein
LHRLGLIPRVGGYARSRQTAEGPDGVISMTSSSLILATAQLTRCRSRA